MYSLEVNFLKDRPEFKTETGRRRPRTVALPTGNWTPLYVGLAVGLLLPALVGAGWWFLQSQNNQLEQQIAEIDKELNTLGIQEQQIKKLQEETDQVKGETQALATVFNQVRPTSALLQDLRDRTPAGIQIEEIKQTAPPAAPAAQPGQPPVPNASGGVEINGLARSFNEVNDFLLTLQRSPFLKYVDTKIVKADLVDNPAKIELFGNQPSSTTTTIKLPRVVNYTIQTSLNDVPASELIRELERKGTLGLVTRIRTLQEKGVIRQ